MRFNAPRFGNFEYLSILYWLIVNAFGILCRVQTNGSTSFDRPKLHWLDQVLEFLPEVNRGLVLKKDLKSPKFHVTIANESEGK